MGKKRRKRKRQKYRKPTALELSIQADQREWQGRPFDIVEFFEARLPKFVRRFDDILIGGEGERVFESDGKPVINKKTGEQLVRVKWHAKDGDAIRAFEVLRDSSIGRPQITIKGGFSIAGLAAELAKPKPDSGDDGDGGGD